MSAMKLLVLPLVLTACDSKGDFAPQEGSWTLGDTPIIDNGCGLEQDPEDNEGGGTATLTMNGDGSGFTIEPDDEDTAGETPVFDCELDGKDYTCEMVGEDLTDIWDLTSEGVDAVINMAVSFGGTFSSETSGIFYTAYEVTCDGTECDIAASAVDMDIPCTTTATNDISAD